MPRNRNTVLPKALTLLFCSLLGFIIVFIVFALWKYQPPNAMSVCFEYATGYKIKGFEIEQDNIHEVILYFKKEAIERGFAAIPFEGGKIEWILEQMKLGYKPIVVVGVEHPSLCVVISRVNSEMTIEDFEPRYRIQCLLPEKATSGKTEDATTITLAIRDFYQNDLFEGILIAPARI